MGTHRVVVMFPGQGVLDRAVPAPVRPYRSLRTIAQSEPCEIADLHLKTFLAAVAAFARLQEETPATVNLVIGHGFGEIAALVAAGAFSVSEGAEIAAARAAALANGPTRRYRMASIEGSPRQVRTLLKLLQLDSVSLAAENSSRESVIVGPSPALLAAADLANALEIRFVLFKTMCGAHHPCLTEAGASMRSTLRHLRRRPFKVPVYSPLRRRLYHDTDDLIACLAEQLAGPIGFCDAMAQIACDVETLVVECGPLHGLAASLDCSAVTDTDFCKQHRLGGDGWPISPSVASPVAALPVYHPVAEVA